MAELDALLRDCAAALRRAVLDDGGAYGDRAHLVVSQCLGRAYELGGAQRSYWQTRYAQEHELLERSERRRRETERELESWRPTPPSAPAAKRQAWRNTSPPPFPPPIPREEPGGRSNDEITQRIDIEVPEEP